MDRWIPTPESFAAHRVLVSELNAIDVDLRVIEGDEAELARLLRRRTVVLELSRRGTNGMLRDHWDDTDAGLLSHVSRARGARRMARG
jgi:hypothetical protein